MTHIVKLRVSVHRLIGYADLVVPYFDNHK